MTAIPIRRALTAPQARAMTTDPALPVALRQGAWLALKAAAGHPVDLARLFPAPAPRPPRVTSPEGVARVIDRLRAGFAAAHPFGGGVA